CFFFQAEDGIRDGHVTGVQTCALPISSPLASWISPEQAMAPALTIGLKGWLSALRRIELKGSPDGSTPMALSTRAAPSVSSASEIGRASCRERVESRGGGEWGRRKG